MNWLTPDVSHLTYAVLAAAAVLLFQRRQGGRADPAPGPKPAVPDLLALLLSLLRQKHGAPSEAEAVAKEVAALLHQPAAKS